MRSDLAACSNSAVRTVHCAGAELSAPSELQATEGPYGINCDKRDNWLRGYEKLEIYSECRERNHYKMRQ